MGEPWKGGVFHGDGGYVSEDEYVWDRTAIEHKIRKMFVGAAPSGVTFGAMEVLHFGPGPRENAGERLEGTGLSLQSPWTLFERRPDRWPLDEWTGGVWDKRYSGDRWIDRVMSRLRGRGVLSAGLGKEPSQDERLRVLCSLRYAEVVDATLDAPLPHLALTFADGRVLFVLVDDGPYESWTAGSGDEQIVVGTDKKIFLIPRPTRRWK